MFFRQKPLSIPSPLDALPGRTTELSIAPNHFVNGAALKGPYPEGAETIYFGLGCFWGAERLFWQLPGVVVTAVDPNSDASDKGIQRGDLILSVNQQPVTTPAQVQAAVEAARRAGRTSVLLLVKRGTGPEAFVGIDITPRQ